MTTSNDPATPATAATAATAAVARRHRRYGWWALCGFLLMGLALELLHGLKAPFYLDPGATLRRELWTLAHAHGTLFGLVNLAFASHVGALAGRLGRRLAVVSHLLIDGSLLVPLGFLLGGAFATEHDPWSGVLLVPVGAICLVVALAQVAVASGADGPPPKSL